MKIAVNTRLLQPGRLDGIGWFTYETMRRITRQHPGHEFHFLFDRPFDPSCIFSHNVSAHVIPPPTRHPLLYILWFDYMLPRWLQKQKPDIFVSPDGMLSLRTPIPQLAVIHDLNFEHRPMDLPYSYRSYYRNRFPKFARIAERIHTVSNYTKKDLVETYGIPNGKIDVGCNGTNMAYKPLSETEKSSVRTEFSGGNPYFMFVGNFHQRKNVHGILSGFADFSKSHPEYKLVLTGTRFWEYPEMQTALKQCDSEKLVWTGHLEVGQLARVLGASEGLVFPSFFEGFGIPLLEAFACNVPVVTSNLTSLPEIAGDAAVYCDPFDPHSIAQSMESLAMEATLRTSLVEAGRKRLKLYSWDKAADALYSSIDRILEKKS